MRRRIAAYVALVVAIGAAWPYGSECIPVFAVLTCLIAYALATVAVTTIRRWRLTRLARNAAFVVSIIVTVFWLISAVAYVRVPYAPKRAVAIGGGSFIYHSGVSIDGTPLTFTAHWVPTNGLFGNLGTSFAFWGKGKAAFSSFTPIWPSAMALAVVTAVLWLFIPRRYPACHCQNCGYNLTGNVSGICPECGKNVPL